MGLEGGALAIRAIGHSGLDALMAYLEDHLQDNGRNGTPIFQPWSRDAPWIASEKVESFRVGMDAPVGALRWRRSWAAYDGDGAIMGHVDLRAHDEPSTDHRALLGMGVHRAHRRRGLGRALVAFALTWAERETALEWIDLRFLGGNVPAERLYQSFGFQVVGVVRDMFRVDGLPVDDVLMARPVHR
jgi:RimJ/RimL family protein N-acetyltransferase